MSDKECEVAIIVPCLNCVDLTKRMIESIRCSENYILTVIDNGCTDTTFEMLKGMAESQSIPFEVIDGSTVCLTPEEKLKSETPPVINK
jgi:glycosyltransferase involved in cell wall biosynthesis